MTAPKTYSGALTRAQLEALWLAAQGLTTGEISAKLGTTRAAVNQRINYGMRSLGARSRTHAVAIATRKGLFGRRQHPNRTQETALLSKAATRLIDEWDALRMPRGIASTLADLLWDIADHTDGPINPWALIVAQEIVGKEEAR